VPTSSILDDMLVFVSIDIPEGHFAVFGTSCQPMSRLRFIVSSLLNSAHGRALFGYLRGGLGFLINFVQYTSTRGGLDGSESSSVTANFVPLQYCELLHGSTRIDSNMGVPPCSGENSAVRTVV